MSLLPRVTTHTNRVPIGKWEQPPWKKHESDAVYDENARSSTDKDASLTKRIDSALEVTPPKGKKFEKVEERWTKQEVLSHALLGILRHGRYKKCSVAPHRPIMMGDFFYWKMSAVASILGL